MTKKLKIVLTFSLLIFMATTIQKLQAAECVKIPTCAEMGYTLTAPKNPKGWACSACPTNPTKFACSAYPCPPGSTSTASFDLKTQGTFRNPSNDFSPKKSAYCLLGYSGDNYCTVKITDATRSYVVGGGGQSTFGSSTSFSIDNGYAYVDPCGFIR